MNRRVFITGLGAILAAPLGAEAQQTGKVWRLGVLAATPRLAPTIPDHHNAFIQELRNLGYHEGGNVLIEWRYSEGEVDRRRQEAVALLKWQPDLIVTPSGGDAAALRAINTRVPIVVTGAGDLVSMGLAASLARPGSNVTGLQILGLDLTPKRVQLLKEVVPQLNHLALLQQAVRSEEETAHYARMFAELETAARVLSLKVQRFMVGSDPDVETVFAEVKRAKTDAIIVAANPFMSVRRYRLGDLATRFRVPTMHEYGAYVQAGGLMSYGVSVIALWRRAAYYVDRILKGASPAELPVEQPTKFELVINLKSAKALGLTIPPSLLLRADQVIDP